MAEPVYVCEYKGEQLTAESLLAMLQDSGFLPCNHLPFVDSMVLGYLENEPVTLTLSLEEWVALVNQWRDDAIRRTGKALGF
jgi:hypothetical protein